MQADVPLVLVPFVTVLPSLSNLFKIVTNCLDVMQWMSSEAMEYENKMLYAYVVKKLTSRIRALKLTNRR